MPSRPNASIAIGAAFRMQPECNNILQLAMATKWRLLQHRSLWLPRLFRLALPPVTQTFFVIFLQVEDPEPPKKKRATLADYMDRKFTKDEQYVAEMAQAFATVMNGHSHHHLEQAWTLDFLRSLRSDYVPLSRKTILSRIAELERNVREQVDPLRDLGVGIFVVSSFQVNVAIQAKGYVAVAVDGWEDHQKFPTLAFTVHVPGGRALLFDFYRVHERETANFLEKAVTTVVQKLKDMGVVVVAVTADNARNLQKGLQLSSNLGMGFVVGQCYAHTLNLFLEDLGRLFKPQLDQMASVEEFFRIRFSFFPFSSFGFLIPHYSSRHAPHEAYTQMKELHGGTALCQPVATRWGSQVDLIGSLVKNRQACFAWLFRRVSYFFSQVVERALLQLRDAKYEFQGSELMFVWNVSWWSTIEKIYNWLQPMRWCVIITDSGLY